MLAPLPRISERRAKDNQPFDKQPGNSIAPLGMGTHRWAVRGSPECASSHTLPPSRTAADLSMHTPLQNTKHTWKTLSRIPRRSLHQQTKNIPTDGTAISIAQAIYSAQRSYSDLDNRNFVPVYCSILQLAYPADTSQRLVLL